MIPEEHKILALLANLQLDFTQKQAQNILNAVLSIERHVKSSCVTKKDLAILELKLTIKLGIICSTIMAISIAILDFIH